MKRVIQIIGGGIGWGFYFFPIVLGGIFNIGTAAGLFVFGGLFLWGVFRPKILGVLPELRRKKPIKLMTNAFCVLFAAGILFSVVLSGVMIGAFSDAPEENATVIVLGCGVNGEKPSKLLNTRIKAAAEYLNEHPEAACVVSGGQGEHEDISEAECMYRELVNAGISPERIHKEDRSTSTRENLLFSHEIIKENGLNESIAVVTNEFHQYRAGKIAEKLGLENGAVPADTPIGLLPVFWTRELAGIVYEWVL